MNTIYDFLYKRCNESQSMPHGAWIISFTGRFYNLIQRKSYLAAWITIKVYRPVIICFEKILALFKISHSITLWWGQLSNTFNHCKAKIDVQESIIIRWKNALLWKNHKVWLLLFWFLRSIYFNVKIATVC